MAYYGIQSGASLRVLTMTRFPWVEIVQQRSLVSVYGGEEMTFSFAAVGVTGIFEMSGSLVGASGDEPSGTISGVLQGPGAGIRVLTLFLVLPQI